MQFETHDILAWGEGGGQGRRDISSGVVLEQLGCMPKKIQI